MLPFCQQLVILMIITNVFFSYKMISIAIALMFLHAFPAHFHLMVCCWCTLVPSRMVKKRRNDIKRLQYVNRILFISLISPKKLFAESKYQFNFGRNGQTSYAYQLDTSHFYYKKFSELLRFIKSLGFFKSVCASVCGLKNFMF